MIRVNCCKTNAKFYYTKNLSRGDYYSQNQEIPGQWGGKGTERLGLSGGVSHEAFAALCDNINPQTGKPLTVRTKTGRRMGYDITFDAPKSISVLQALSKDTRILDAYNKAVADTMIDIETHAQTRVRRQGQDENRTTGNLIYAKFTHFTARPQGGIPDPQLHTHVFVLNATFDEQEDRWKAVEVGQTKADAPYYQAAFNSRLAENLRAIGYAIRPTQYAFEIEGVPQAIIDEFSKRKTYIEKVAHDKGITNAKAKSRLGALTREAKRHDISVSELNELWTLRLSHLPAAQQKSFAAMLQLPAEIPKSIPDPEAEHRAILLAREHCFYHQSVVDEKHFVATALRFSIGETNVERLRQAVANDTTLLHYSVNGRAVITAPEVLLQEEHLVGWVRRGLATCPPLAYGYTPSNPKLDDEMRQALRHVLESRDRVTGVHGKSGAGKTTLIKEAIPAIVAQGHHVTILAPTTDASRKTLCKEGFPEAETVEMLLQSPLMQQRATGGVLWVDEAGMLSVPAMKRLTDLAETINARIIFSGDTRQHSSVERGDALRLLRNHAGLEMAELNKIRRQKDPACREAIDDLAEGRIVEGFKKLDAMGAIREISDGTLHEYLAGEYLNSIRMGRTALVISPTHAEGRKMTDLIRQGLKEEGKLANAQAISTFQKIDLTPAEKKDLRLYCPGWVIEMSKAAPGCRPGERMVIENTDEQGLFVRHADGHIHLFDPTAFATRFEVYKHAVLDIGIGEHIRITRNGKAADGRHKLNSGSFAIVKGFTSSGDIRLETGAVIPRHYGHITHGYVTTSYAAQSKTVQDIFIAESMESFPAAGWEQFYVSVSRFIERLILATDNKEALLRIVQISRQRLAAMDIAYREESPPAHPLDRAEDQIEKSGETLLPVYTRLGQRRKPDAKLPIPVQQPRRERELEFEP